MLVRRRHGATPEPLTELGFRSGSAVYEHLASARPPEVAPCSEGRGETRCLAQATVRWRRGVIAMRRVGFIVALAALLGMSGGVVTAAPALAGGRGADGRS
jgi:hypothetical protein